jgi:hypothetical protein
MGKPNPDCPYCHGEGVTGGIDNRPCDCTKPKRKTKIKALALEHEDKGYFRASEELVFFEKFPTDKPLAVVTQADLQKLAEAAGDKFELEILDES